MYDVLSSRKKKLKRFPSLKFRRSKSEILRPPLLEMTSMIHVLSHPGFESVSLNSWVLVTATIGLQTKQKKAFTTLFAEGNTTDT